MNHSTTSSDDGTARQLSFLPAPPANGTATSQAAARVVAPRVGSMQHRIVEWLRARGAVGGTCCEAQQALAMKPQTASARFQGLREDGLIRRTSRTRPTDSGCRAFVHVAGNTAILDDVASTVHHALQDVDFGGGGAAGIWIATKNTSTRPRVTSTASIRSRRRAARSTRRGCPRRS